MKRHNPKVNMQENRDNKANDDDDIKSIINNFSGSYSAFPKMRLRRLRKSEAIRDLLQETHLSVKDLVFPLFVQEGIDERIEIESMPGVFRFPLGEISGEI